jgi:hypothetical protein
MCLETLMKTTRDFIQIIWSLSRDFNLGLPEHGAGVLRMSVETIRVSWPATAMLSAALIAASLFSL